MAKVSTASVKVEGAMKIEFEPDRTLYPFESKRFASSAGEMH
jgi:hypothetical protein